MRERIFPGTIPALTPLDLAPDQWFRSDSVVLAGADVATLTDKSGNGNHGTGTAGSRPSWDNSGPLPKIIFDKASAEHINWPCLAAPAAWTFILIAQIPSIGPTEQLWHSHQDAAGNQGAVLYVSSPNLILGQYGDGSDMNLGAVNTSLIQRDAQWTGTVKRYRENAGAWTSNACLGIDVAGATTGTLGAYYSGVQAINLVFYESIYWLRALSDPELAKIRAYVLRHYSSVLP